MREKLYYADLREGIGSEWEGYRPAVVILQNDLQNQHSPTVTVAAIISRKKERTPIRCHLNWEAGLKYSSMIRLERLCTIDSGVLASWCSSICAQ